MISWGWLKCPFPCWSMIMEKFFCANLRLDDFTFWKSCVLMVSLYEVSSALIAHQSLQSMKCLAQNGEIVSTTVKVVVLDISHFRMICLFALQGGNGTHLFFNSCMRRISVCNFLGSLATKKTLQLLSYYYCIHGLVGWLVGWWTCAGGNEYGQCAEELGRHMEGKLLHRDISIPQRCCPRLRVRQVWINGSRISALCLFSHWPQPISIANPTSFYQIRGCLRNYCYFTQSTSFHEVCHDHRNSLPIVQVAAGGTHSVVLTEDGDVWTWGQPWPPGDMYVVVNWLIMELQVFCLFSLVQYCSVHIINPWKCSITY